MTNVVQVYGTDWCGLTRGVREFLMKSGIPYDYYDVDQDPRANDFVRAMSDGRRRFPLVVVEEELIANPTLDALQRVLAEQGLSRGPAGRKNGARIRSLLLESV